MEEKKDEIKNDKNEINNNNEIKDKNENIKNVKINDENVNEENKLNNVHFTEILNYDGKKKLEIYHLALLKRKKKEHLEPRRQQPKCINLK